MNSLHQYTYTVVGKHTHKTQVAHLVITIHQLLFTEAQQLASSQKVCTLNCASGAESPARTTSTLQSVNKNQA